MISRTIGHRGRIPQFPLPSRAAGDFCYHSGRKQGRNWAVILTFLSFPLALFTLTCAALLVLLL